MPHELFHVFAKDMERVMNSELAERVSPQFLKDWEIAKKWLGAQEGTDTLSKAQHEKFAEGFIRYLDEGKAPTLALARVFAKFKAWLLNVYDSLKGSKKLTKEMRGMFDRMFAGDGSFAEDYSSENTTASYGKLNGETLEQSTKKPNLEVVERKTDESNTLKLADLLNSPNVVAERHAKFRPFFNLVKAAYQKQENLRATFSRAADSIFGGAGILGRKGGLLKTDEQRESLTEILLQGDAAGKIFTNDELNAMGADEAVKTAYKRVRTTYDRAHNMINAQRNKYGKSDMAYREGYVPHIFHAWRVIDADGKIITSFRSMNEAVKAAEQMLKNSPDDKLKVAPVLDDFGGQANLDAVVLGDVQYQKLMENVKDTFALSVDEARQVLEDVARKKNRSRVFKNAFERKGSGGYDTNMEYALRHYLNLSARYIAMDTVKHDGINLFERTFGRYGNEHEGVADYAKQYLQSALGVPSMMERILNGFIRKSPIYKYTKDFIGDRPATVLANTIAKYVAVGKLGFLNLTSAAMNFTQLIGTNAIIGEKYTALGLAEYVRPSARTKAIYRATGVENNITMENPSGYSGIHKAHGFVLDAAMSAFRFMDGMARKVTVLGAYRKAIAEGKSHAQAIAYAQKVNDDTNFDYSVADSPHFLRQSGPIGTLLFQFKKYPVKLMELALPGYGKLKGMEQVRFWVPMLLLSGIFGVPGGDLLKDLIKKMFGEKDIELEIKKAVMESDLPNPLKRTMLYGVLSNLGLDVGRRVGMGDFIPSELSDFTGPGLSTIGALWQAIPKIWNDGNFLDTIEAMSPGIANPIKAFMGETRDKKRGRQKFKYEGALEKSLRAVGTRPIREAVESDNLRISRYEKGQQTDEETEAIDDFVAVYGKHDTPEYKNALARLGELRIDPARVKREIQLRSQGSAYDRELIKTMTPKGYQEHLNIKKRQGILD